MSENDQNSEQVVVTFPAEMSVKKLKTFTIELDQCELIETGTKIKKINGKDTPIKYMKFKVYG